MTNLFVSLGAVAGALVSLGLLLFLLGQRFGLLDADALVEQDLERQALKDGTVAFGVPYEWNVGWDRRHFLPTPALLAHTNRFLWVSMFTNDTLNAPVTVGGEPLIGLLNRTDSGVLSAEAPAAHHAQFARLLIGRVQSSIEIIHDLGFSPFKTRNTGAWPVVEAA